MTSLLGPDTRCSRSRIRVRRFAGSARHVAQLDSPIRVAHLTDLHVGRITPRSVQERAVELTNEARPDLVAITGDFVCHSQSYLDFLEYIVSGFSAPVVAVLGNHDHWAGADEVRRSLARAGAEVLENSSTVITLNGCRLQVLGLGDSYTGYADIKRTLQGIRTDLPSLGLSHIAEEADHFWRGGVPLVLSGHTHGGQVTLASLHEIAMGKVGGHRYIHGLYGRRSFNGGFDGAVYVGAGIGASVMPLRMGERGAREVALFDLGIDPATIPEHHDEQKALPGRPPSSRKRAKRMLRVYRQQAFRMRTASLRGYASSRNWSI